MTFPSSKTLEHALPAAAAHSVGDVSQVNRQALLWFGGTAAVYWLATHHLPMVNKQYVYLAHAFLQGSLSVPDPPPGLVETIQFNGANYFAYGIMPAILLMPFVAIWGVAFEPASVVIAMGAVNVALMYRVLRQLEFPESVSHWTTALFAFGTVHFHASVWGTTWFYMQVTAVLFLLLAIDETLGQGRGWLVGLWLGAAVLSRNALIVAAPFFLLMLNGRSRSWVKTAQFGAGVAICVVVGGVYNVARFGDFSDTGYGRIFSQPYGLFSLHYLANNLQTYLFALPERLSEFPYLRPDPQGMSLLLTTPAWLLLARATRRDRLTLAAWLATAAVGSLYLLYFWSGYAQFGMRYTLDFTPFLIILTAIACGGAVGAPARALITLSMMIQLWGVAWWRFGQLNVP